LISGDPAADTPRDILFSVNPDFFIALCCNGTMLPGLHATLFSLVSKLSQRERVHLNLFITEVNEAEVDSIRGTVSDAGGVGALTFHQADLSAFKGLKALQGDWMAYMRLYLPTLMPEAGTILYLDSDLIINTDACAFFSYPLENAPLAAVLGETVQWNLDRDFLQSVGLGEEDRCFNSGVLIFNARMWREKNLIEQALEFGRAHAAALQSADQTILIALYSRTFLGLPAQFNLGIFAHQLPKEMKDGIYHFVGSPKPWDPLGRQVHGNWKLWNSVITKTRFRWGNFILHHWRTYAARAWTLRRSYFRTLRRKL
jgi:lipopolysaccharide biosynthesis glycosyltransferase